MEIRDACIEDISDERAALSAPDGKMGSNLLICICHLHFCVASNPGQLTGKGCKRQLSEALFNSYLNMSQSLCVLSHRELGRLQVISRMLQSFLFPSPPLAGAQDVLFYTGLR